MLSSVYKEKAYYNEGFRQRMYSVPHKHLYVSLSKGCANMIVVT